MSSVSQCHCIRQRCHGTRVTCTEAPLTGNQSVLGVWGGCVGSVHSHGTSLTQALVFMWGLGPVGTDYCVSVRRALFR